MVSKSYKAFNEFLTIFLFVVQKPKMFPILDQINLKS